MKRTGSKRILARIQILGLAILYWSAQAQSGATAAIDGVYHGTIGNQRIVLEIGATDSHLSIVQETSYFCGGPHPDASTEPLVYDMRTGRTLDLEDLFRVQESSAILRDGVVPPGPTHSLLLRLYQQRSAKSYGECDKSDITGDITIKMYFDQSGLVIVPELAYAASVCGPKTTIPCEELRPLLIAASMPFSGQKLAGVSESMQIQEVAQGLQRREEKPRASAVAREYSPHLVVYDATRLKSYSTNELIDLLSSASLEKNARSTGNGFFYLSPPDRRQAKSTADPKLYVEMKIDPHATDYTLSVEQEIARRRPYKNLSDIFARTTDVIQLEWIADVLGQMRGTEADVVLHPYVSNSREETTYFALKYFARACDSTALGILNRNYFKYPGSSMEWATIVRSFGDCRYKPAVPNLVGTVNAAMIDLGYASHLSLLAMYPDAKIEFRDPLVAQNAWKKYLRTHR